MPDTSGPWVKPVSGRSPLVAWIGVSANDVRWTARMAMVALGASWLGFYLITALPFLDIDAFRATITLHAVTGLVFIPYLATLLAGRRLPGGSPLDAPLMALLGVYLLTTATSLHWRVSLEVTLTVLMAMGVFYVLSDHRLFRRWQAEWILMLAALAAAVYALWVVAGDYLDWLQLSDAVRGGGLFGDLVPPTVPKVHDVGDHPNLLGGILAMTLPFFLAGMLRTKIWPLRALMGLATVVVLLAMFFTLARSSWLGGAAGAFAMALALVVGTPGGRAWLAGLRPSTPRRQLIVGAAGFAFALLLLAGGLVARSTDARPIWLFRDSGTPRLDVMGAGVEMLADYPLFGTGPGLFSLLYPAYSGRFPNHAFHTHNGFLQTAVDMGVPGVLAMLALAGALAWLVLRGVRDTKGGARLSMAACGGAFVAFGVFSLMESPNGFKGPLVALAAVGAIAVLSYRERTARSGGDDTGSVVPLGWLRTGRATQLAARIVVPVAMAGLLIAWGRIDLGHYYYDDGLVQANQRRWPEAVEQAQRAVDLDPQLGIYRLQLGAVQGQAYQATGDPSLLAGGIAELERGVELEPRSAVGHANLALLLAEAGDREATRAAALAAVEFANADPAVVLAAGTALEATGWGDEASEAYATALFLDLGLADSPFWSQSGFRLINFANIVGQSAIALNQCSLLWLAAQPVPAGPLERQEALEGCIERIVGRDIAEDRVVLAEALIRDDAMELAFDQLDYVLSRQPDFGMARTALGRWYAAQGDLAQARDQWLQGGQLGEVEALVLLGDSYTPGAVPPEVVEALRAELRSVASQVQFHLTGILYYRFKFFRGSPVALLVPGEWQDAVPGRFSRATAALARWEEEAR